MHALNAFNTHQSIGKVDKVTEALPYLFGRDFYGIHNGRLY